MDVKQFAEIFEEQFAISDSMLNSKRKEYAGEKIDVLHNFRQTAHLEQTNMRKAVSGFMVKHTVSIYDMMHEDGLRPLEVWDEKITDHINYLILLKAIVVEELEAQQVTDDLNETKFFLPPTPTTEPDKDLSE